MKFPRRGRRVLAAFSMTVAAAIALAGCSSGTPATTTAPSDPAKVSGAITFSAWWAYANQALIDGFKTKYPNVKVTLNFTAIDSYPTKLQSLASAGNLPDVFAAQGPTLVALSKANQLYDLKGALAQPAYDGSASWKSTFNPTLLSGANAGTDTAGGKTAGIPFNAISVASVYNKTAFEKAGVTPPTDFAGLLSNCQKLHDAGYIPMSLTGKVWGVWWPFLAWDQTMKGEKASSFSVSDPNYIKGFQLVKQMADAHCWDSSQVATDIAGETSLFLQQKTAQFVTVPENFLQSVSEGAKFPLGSYVLPAMDGKTPNRILGGGNANVIAISAKTKNPAAAIAFAKYLTSDAVETKLAKENFTLPSTNVDVSSSSPLMSAYLKAASNGFTDSAEYLPTMTPAGATKFANEIFPALVLGKISPAQAAAETSGIYAK